MIPQSLIDEGKRGGVVPWTTVEYESLARVIKRRCLEENPACEASIGLLDDTFIIWIRPIPPFVFTG